MQSKIAFTLTAHKFQDFPLSSIFENMIIKIGGQKEDKNPKNSKNPALDIQRRKFYLSCETAVDQALRASSTRTAQATVAPTMGLLPEFR